MRVRKTIYFCGRLVLVAALLPLAFQFAQASTPLVLSGSYSVVHKRTLGSKVQIRVRIHLTNHGPSDLSIRRMTLWNYSHPDKGGSRPCAVTLHAHASADTIQEFVVSRSDYQRWQKGFRPRFVLEIAGPQNAIARTTVKSTAVVRLDRNSGQEGN